MNRLKYIDVAKGIGIILMVFNHFDYDNLMIQRFIASFHMPLFFFLAGFTFWPSNWQNKSIPSYIFSRFIQLMIPYFIFSFMWQTEISLNALATILYGYTNIGPLWFLPCMFIASVIFFSENKALRKLYDKHFLFSLFPFLINLIFGITLLYIKKDLPLNLANAFIGTAFMDLGLLTFRVLQLLPTFKDSNFFLLPLCIISYIAVFFLANLNSPVFNFHAKRVVMATGDYGNLFNFIPVAILGCFATLALSKLIQNSKLLNYIGINTITILVVHYYYPKLIIDKVFNHLPIPEGSIFIPIIGTICLIAICLPIACFLSKYAPVLIGKKQELTK